MTPTGATKCKCRPNGNYVGGRRFDRAMDCFRDEDFASGVRIADQPMHGTRCRRRQQRTVARHDAVAIVLTTRLRSLPGDGRRRTAGAYRDTTGSEGRPESGREGVQVAHRRRLRVPRHQVSGGQAVHARQSSSVCEGR